MPRKVTSELLTPENIQRVIDLLEVEGDKKPITKKEACEILGINYNTTRLNKLIEEYKERVAYRNQRYAENKRKPASEDDIKFIISSYIEGDPISSIAEALYRPSSFVKKILIEKGVQLRPATHDYFKPELVAEVASKDRFSLGETVFCTRYNVNAIIKAEELTKKHGYVYRVYLLGNCQMYANIAAYDLASLEHLKDYINV